MVKQQFLSLTDASSDADIARFRSWQKEKKGTMVIWYHADWCGHCTAMEKDWEKFAAHASRTYAGLRLVAARDTALERLGLSDQVEMGFPTIRIYRGGKMVEEFTDGARTAENLQAFVEKNYEAPEQETIVGGSRRSRRRRRQRGGARLRRRTRSRRTRTHPQVPPRRRNRHPNARQ